MADFTSNTPSRRATLLGAVAITSASVVVMGSAKASPISPALQKAFDEWQQARSAFETVDKEFVQPALERFYVMTGGPRRDGGKVPTPEERAVIDAANEMSGMNAAEKIADTAHGEMSDAFDRFIRTTPRTMADIQLQAKHMAVWLEDCQTESLVFDWLETVTRQIS